MKIFTATIIILFVLFLIVVVFYSICFYHKVQISKELINKATLFEIKSTDFSKSILVLGDSTAVGVGADKPEETIAGLISNKVGGTYVENKAVSGALTEDLVGQIKKVTQKHYSLVIILIGGNDIIRFHSLKDASLNLDKALNLLSDSDKVIVMSAGNVGGSTLFPSILNYFYTKKNLEFHQEFDKVCKANNRIYVKLYRPPKEDVFALQPEVYLSKDGLHPSSLGYKEWFDRMKGAL